MTCVARTNLNCFMLYPDPVLFEQVIEPLLSIPVDQNAITVKLNPGQGMGWELMHLYEIIVGMFFTGVGVEIHIIHTFYPKQGSDEVSRCACLFVVGNLI